MTGGLLHRSVNGPLSSLVVNVGMHHPKICSHFEVVRWAGVGNWVAWWLARTH